MRGLTKLDDERVTIYQAPIDANDDFDPRSIVTKWIRPGNRVLDVGCACGDLGVYLKGRFDCEVHGLEFNVGSIEIAKNTNSYASIHQVDLNVFSPDELPLQGCFDVIVVCDVLEHLLDPLATVQKLRHFLKPDGFLLLSIPNVTHASVKILLLSNKICYTKKGLLDETHLHFFTWRSIHNLLSRASLDTDDLDIVLREMDGGFPGGVHGYVADRRILRGILREDESYVFQYVVKASHSSSSGLSLKEFRLLVDRCFNNRSTEIDKLRLKDFKRLYLLHPFTLQMRYIGLKGRMLAKMAMNRIAPSARYRRKIDSLATKSRYLKQALKS